MEFQLQRQRCRIEFGFSVWYCFLCPVIVWSLRPHRVLLLGLLRLNAGARGRGCPPSCHQSEAKTMDCIVVVHASLSVHIEVVQQHIRLLESAGGGGTAAVEWPQNERRMSGSGDECNRRRVVDN